MLFTVHATHSTWHRLSFAIESSHDKYRNIQTAQSNWETAQRHALLISILTKSIESTRWWNVSSPDQSEIAFSRRRKKTVLVDRFAWIRCRNRSMRLCSNPAAYRSRQRLTSFQWLINELNSFNPIWNGRCAVAIAVVVILRARTLYRTKWNELLTNTNSGAVEWRTRDNKPHNKRCIANKSNKFLTNELSHNMHPSHAKLTLYQCCCFVAQVQHLLNAST